MSRYIDADKVIEKEREHCNGCFHKPGDTYCCVCPVMDIEKAIEKAPTADVVEVRHGKWIEVERDVFECSHCKKYKIHGCFIPKPRYCGYCGAKMDGKDGDDK